MSKYFNKFKKTLLLAHFPFLGTNFFSPKNPALLSRTSNWFLIPSQNLEKVNDSTPTSFPDRQAEERMDGRQNRRNLFSYFGGKKSFFVHFFQL